MSDTSVPEQENAAQPHSATDDLKQTAGKATATIANEVREGVLQGAGRAREQAATRTEDAKTGIAREMAATAEALDAAARDLQEHSLQRSLLGEASRGLVGLSRALEGRSVGELVGDVAEFGRRNPAAFLGGAALAGFAVARLATASAPADGSQQQEADAFAATAPQPRHLGVRPAAASETQFSGPFPARPFGGGDQE
jgi:hypothetical protein